MPVERVREVRNPLGARVPRERGVRPQLTAQVRELLPHPLQPVDHPRHAVLRGADGERQPGLRQHVRVARGGVGVLEHGERLGERRRARRAVAQGEPCLVTARRHEWSVQRQIEVPGHERARTVRPGAHERFAGRGRPQLRHGGPGVAQVPPHPVQPRLPFALEHAHGVAARAQHDDLGGAARMRAVGRSGRVGEGGRQVVRQVRALGHAVHPHGAVRRADDPLLTAKPICGAWFEQHSPARHGPAR